MTFKGYKPHNGAVTFIQVVTMSLSSPTSHDPRGYVLPGLANVLANASGTQDHLDVEADIEGEQETMLADADDDEMDSDSDDADSNINQEPASGSLPSQWQETMAHAAKGVTDNTHREYVRYGSFCLFNILYLTP